MARLLSLPLLGRLLRGGTQRDRCRRKLDEAKVPVEFSPAIRWVRIDWWSVRNYRQAVISTCRRSASRRLEGLRFPRAIRTRRPRAWVGLFGLERGSRPRSSEHSTEGRGFARGYASAVFRCGAERLGAAIPRFPSRRICNSKGRRLDAAIQTFAAGEHSYRFRLVVKGNRRDPLRDVMQRLLHWGPSRGGVHRRALRTVCGSSPATPDAAWSGRLLA